jgi:translation initiation factor IF-2
VIGLVADLQDLKANPNRAAVGTIVESRLDRGRGPVATVLVQNGTLRTGDVALVGRTYGKVRAMTTAVGERVGEAGPSSAVELLGLADVPEAGDILRVVADEKAARTQVEAAERAAGQGDGRTPFSLEDISAQVQASQVKELRIVLKADVQGSLGAIRHALEQLNTDDVRVSILREGAGDVTESDVLLASASDAVVIGFNTRPDPGAVRAQEASGVDVRTYDIIYKLTDEVQRALSGMLEPVIAEVIEGHAEVRLVIKAGRTTVAGSYVLDGRIVRGAQARLMRGGTVAADTRVETLRRFKEDVREVAAGFECGIGLAGNPDLAEGDVIECFSLQAEPR